jgi:hypothetical protein
MQTPEQIAEHVWRDLNYEGRREYVIPLIAAALRDYGDARAAEERERCASIAESFIPSGFRGATKLGNAFGVARDDRARVIAAAIRANADQPGA